MFKSPVTVSLQGRLLHDFENKGKYRPVKNNAGILLLLHNRVPPEIL
jgi:hypothetical protein